MSSIIISVINDSLAQLVEHLTLNQQVPGSSPGWVTSNFKALQIFCRAFFVTCCQICCQNETLEMLSFKIESIILTVLF